MVARSLQVQVALRVLAELGAEAAKALAPERTGRYREDITVDVGVSDKGIAMARINANDFKSVWIEFGTGDPGPTEAFAPLRRGCEAAGLDLKGE